MSTMKPNPALRPAGLVCAALFLALMLEGCISTSPTDLAFESASVVDRHDQVELLPSTANPAAGLINESQRNALLAQEGLAEKPHEMLLKVTFSSHTNLAAFLMRRTVNLWAGTCFCSHPQDEAIMSGGSVFWQGTWLNGLEHDPIQGPEVVAGAPISYYLFINVARQAVVPANPVQISYDLRSKAEDICFYLHGGNGSGGGFKSNIVLVPKEAISAALDSPAHKP